MITRRTIIKSAGGLLAGAAGLGGYGIGIEPLGFPHITSYRVSPPRWPRGLRLSIAVVADVHACEPWMPASRIARIAEATNALGPDMIALLGDYTTGHRFVRSPVPTADWARALGTLRAPLGVHAVLGNHDWWADIATQITGTGPPEARRALEDRGIRVLENAAVRLVKDGRPFWIAGLGDQLAYFLMRMPERARGTVRERYAATSDQALAGAALGVRQGRFIGTDDLDGTLARVRDDAPVILLAHEPDVFPRVPDRVALTISGHTHGGQVRILGWAPAVPSRYRRRFDYGHVVESGRSIVVSGGLGCSILPVRLGMPPEIVMIEVAA